MIPSPQMKWNYGTDASGRGFFTGSFNNLNKLHEQVVVDGLSAMMKTLEVVCFYLFSLYVYFKV